MKGFTNVLHSLLAVALAGAVQQQTGPARLDARIPNPIREKYERIRDGKDWLNPYLQVCADAVTLTVRSVAHEQRLGQPADVRDALLRLRVEAWPYGRVIAVQDCSIRLPGDAEGHRQRIEEVLKILKGLDLEISRWPP